MKFQEALRLAKKYSSVIFLNHIISPFLRGILITFSFFISILVVILLGIREYALYQQSFFEKYYTIVLLISSHTFLLFVILGIMFTIFITLYPLEMYFRYYFLNSVERDFDQNKERFVVSYEASLVLLQAEKSSFVEALLSLPDSNFIMNRLLIREDIVRRYNLTTISDIDDDLLLYNKTVTLGSLWKLFYFKNDDFKKELLSQKITEEIYSATCDWLDRILEDEKREYAWWWRENLSKTRGVWKSLSYGTVPYIHKFARELLTSSKREDVGKVILHKNSVKQLENTLSHTSGANALIIGEKGTGRHTLIKVLAQMIDQGSCYAEIENKRVFEFDNATFGTLNSEEFTDAFVSCFEDALLAKNIIFVIDDISALVDISRRLGVNFFQILERYSNHPHISFVCICDESFYRNEEHKIFFDKDFEIIRIPDIDNQLLMPYLQDHAVLVEKMTGKFFPSHSLSILASTLTKYFVEDSPLVTTDDLMYTMAENHRESDHVILDEDAIAEVIKSMLGVSTGEITPNEKEKLLHLEDLLHKKVVGQNEAIKSIAGTMRRSRTGLTNSSKPIGSFLFLGPTGVGKTETAKALAEVFFGSEEYMSRIDMNEYTMGNSAYRLLGNNDDEGELAKLIHSRPYGVLLLDEFEKSTEEVKDVFLRLLDEGVFTNGDGKLISARTQIIIATSNAGSSYIQTSGLSPSSSKEDIENITITLLDTIIGDGLFRRELINRFDATILFHPLGDESKILVAKNLLKALSERALKQGYVVTFTDALIQKISNNEKNTNFGGRAIQRNIQTDIEEALAKKIIEGSLRTGDTIVLDSIDIG